MKVAEALREASTQLAATSDTARLDAEVLMAHALGVLRSEMLLRCMMDPVPAAFGGFVERRAEHEPVAYITGEQEFYGLNLAVAPGALIPRGDSETLIEASRKAFADRDPPESILDLGTGSGALLLAAMSVFPEATGLATDRSPAVESIVRRNIARHCEGRTVSFELADWHQLDWADALGSFDLVLCNPPYVKADAALDPDVSEYEPAEALFAGPEGLDDYRVLIPQMHRLLNLEGVAVFEIGASQAESVAQIAQTAGFAVEIRQDLANRPRCVILR
ncbi:MAG: peptide chain release factor N(5)-glutamine methyltransferase [Pseudomonadota bacterium]